MDLETLTSPLMSALGAVGHVLDTPRRALYGGLSALTGNDWKGFGDVVSSTGLMDKDTTGYGLVDFLGNVATDPLTWGGLAAGRYLNALQPGGRVGAGLGKASTKATAPQMGNMRSLLDDIPVVDKVDVLEPGMQGFQRGARAGMLPDTKDARNMFRTGEFDERQMIGRIRRNLDQDPAAWRAAAGPQARATREAELGNRMMQELDVMESGTRAGTYSNEAMGAGNRPMILVHERGYNPQGTLRHESMHGMIDQAIRTGQIDRLPSWMSRTSARLQSGNAPGSVKGSIGSLMDEAAAQAVESRSGLQQARNVGAFLFNPELNSAYTQGYQAAGSMNPRVLGLYSRLPGLAQPATTTAAASPGALLRLLNGE